MPGTIRQSGLAIKIEIYIGQKRHLASKLKPQNKQMHG